MNDKTPITIFFAAFIHRDLLAANDGWAYEPVFGRSQFRETMFKGDMRDFSQHSDLEFTSRLWTRITIEAGSIGRLPKPVQSNRVMHRRIVAPSGVTTTEDANGLVCEQPGCKIESWVGPTRRRTRVATKFKTHATPMGVPVHLIEEWGPWTIESKTAKNESSPPEIENVQGSSSQITVECAAAYPFLPAPTIDYDFDITMKRTGVSTVEMTIEGSHNRFPYYELIIAGTSIYRFTPSSSGPNPWNLGISSRDFVKKLTLSMQKGRAVVVLPNGQRPISVER